MKYELKEMSLSKVSVLTASCYNGSIYKHEAKKYKELYNYFNKELQPNTKTRREAVVWFVCTALQALRHDGSGFLVSFTANHYTGNKHISYRGVKWVTDALEESGYIDIYYGFVSKWGANKEVLETVSSLVKFKQPLLEVLSCVDIKKVPKLLLANCVEIRDRETKELKPLRGYKELEEIRERVMKLNQKLSETKIVLDGTRMSSVQMKRVFADNLEFGGRFYVVGGGVQTAPKMLRYTSLYIDDKPVVELDYKSMHPHILLEKLNIHEYNGCLLDHIGESFDPYATELYDLVRVDKEKLENHRKLLGNPKYDPVRTFKKKALLVMLNADSIESAVGAMCQALAEDNKPSRNEMDKDFVGICEGVKVKQALLEIAEHNEVIKDFFFCDVAMGLMKIDSSIADRVAEICMQAGHPVLIYHDSFIVKEEAEDLLYNAMRLAWKEEVGDNKFCKIEKK